MGKRKLDKVDVPQEVARPEKQQAKPAPPRPTESPEIPPEHEAADSPEEEQDEPSMEEVTKAEENATFESLGLDSRLLQAIAELKFATPTPVQAKAIPLALEGRDILARAKTGSGKTAAYILPILQTWLKTRSSGKKARSTSALILVPTRELGSQITKVIGSLAAFCSKQLRVVDLTPQVPEQAQRALLAQSPDIVVATPARAAAHLQNSSLDIANLSHLVIDEADIVLSYDCGDDFDNIVKFIRPGVQTFLASATLTLDVDTLKGLFCRNPVILDLSEDEKENSTLSQYVVRCAEDEKFLLSFALFKLKLVKGKTIVFVADVDRSYRLKLFLEQFGIKSCILNAELPVNCRIHVVEEFNKGVYDIIIATDETQATTEDSDAKVADADEPTANGEPKKKKRKRGDVAYGVSRGIDFHNVACVLNFDLPSTPSAYTHRIGRTARAGRTGVAISLVIPRDQYRKHKHTTHPANANDEVVAAKIASAQLLKGHPLQPYGFDMAKIAGFRYRVASALQAAGAGAVREARLRELRREMLNSARLKRHLQENPEDEKWLRHDGELRPAAVQPHMRHVPEYLMPGGGAPGKTLDSLAVGFAKAGPDRRRGRGAQRGKAGGRPKPRAANPLKFGKR